MEVLARNQLVGTHVDLLLVAGEHRPAAAHLVPVLDVGLLVVVSALQGGGWPHQHFF